MTDIAHRLRTSIVLLDAEREEAANEIERLRAEVSALKADAYAAAEVGFAVARHDAAKQKAEIERLRQEADQNQWRKDWHILAAEIERLRKLVQEALNGPGWMDEHWHDAARDALGEKT